ncbi:sigma-54 dependent transcriptional regulator [Aureispira sp. CCB-E]|uniref:sigma-54 dependent transcriptional regulator n=1 Tax=Aureispira sp. CCB-E TaxID=3051121 RepID=UPI0028697721|nr:sigma-54 dependent transcriptional regulator [Aureispira sp. CCB-E]WMX17575.1 sigma-54 dependent transcriptional regulator [Aureispira sp. CCB-E]
MEKILISWLAIQNDFVQTRKGKEINLLGPNYLYHQHYYDYEKHILLSSAKSEEVDTAGIFFKNKLYQDFPKHQVQLEYIDIKDVIDLNEVYQKVLPILITYRTAKIDIFFSPGTAVMRLVWFICHQTLGLDTALIQTRKPIYGKTLQPERIYLELQRDAFPSGLIIREANQKQKLKKIPKSKQICITSSLEPVYEEAFKVAQTDVTALILGESGTGKEHLAKYIHQQSLRKDAPFITVNCSAMRDDLLESRLYGHKKGSFTGAITDQEGLFEKAEGGSVFLDEIGDISLYMQQSLLRILQEKEIQPIGKIPKKVNVRIIAATNKDLIQCCEEGKFRWDLYYRLSIVDLEIPSFRSFTKADKKKLINFFLKLYGNIYSRSISLSKKLEEEILTYAFPGNIRELENMIERFYVLGKGQIETSLLPNRIKSPQIVFSTKLSDMEKQHIKKVLEQYHYNLSQTAKALGIVLNTLKKKILLYNIKRK